MNDHNIEQQNNWDDRPTYLIVSKTPFMLSTLLDDKSELHTVMVSPSELNEDYLSNSDLTLVIDDKFETSEAQSVTQALKQASRHFAVISSNCYRAEWESSGFPILKSINRKLSNVALANRLIESLYLTGLVCIDHYDMHAQFELMCCSSVYEGEGHGEFRAIKAIDNALDGLELEGSTVTLILYSGLSGQIEEWEQAMAYLDGKAQDHACIIGALKLLPGHDDSIIKAVIFANSAQTDDL